jgi:THO complex subunit 2
MHVFDRDESGTTRATTATSPGKPERDSRLETGGSSRSRNISASGFANNGSAGGSQTAPMKAQAPISSRGGERGNQDGGSRRSSDLKNESSSKNTESDPKVAEREQKKLEANDAYVKGPASRSPVRREDIGVSSLRQTDELGRERQTKRFVNQDDAERGPKRRKGPEKNVEVGEVVRPSERDRFPDQRMVDSRGAHDVFEKGPQERSLDRSRDRINLRGAERAVDRVERDSRPTERVLERLDRDRGDEYPSDRHRDRSIENFGRERSSDRASDRVVSDRLFERGSERVREDRVKDERVRQRYSDLPGEQPHPDDRFPMQNQPQSLPPPPPIPPNVVPRTVSASRMRIEEALEGRPVRNVPRLSSPRPHEKPDKRRTDDSGGLAMEAPRKRRDDDEVRNRKRVDDREMQALKVCGPPIIHVLCSPTGVCLEELELTGILSFENEVRFCLDTQFVVCVVYASPHLVQTHRTVSISVVQLVIAVLFLTL